ncbi:MAG: 3-oxo-tetronate kinase [Verrucomicrobiota bacterium]
MQPHFSRTPILGCIADDFTGASDLAGFILKSGLRVVQVNGVPRPGQHLSGDYDAVVIALKSRTCPIEEAIQDSVSSLNWLKGLGCQKFYFKYCSTFDSTSRGNIGPVAEALMEQLNCPQTIFCPALPVNGRTVYQGHLFVFDQLLSDSPLRNHPLTPMRDSSLIRLLQAQLTAPNRERVALLDHASLTNAPVDADEYLNRFVVTDCIDDADLEQIAKSFGLKSDWPLLTGGSGLGEYLGREYLDANLIEPSANAGNIQPNPGRTLFLAGSCSEATRQQVARAQEAMPSYELDVAALAKGQINAEDIFSWVQDSQSEACLVYSSATPDAVATNQEQFGVGSISELIEECFTQVATLARRAGILNLVVAGGETSGAIVRGLGLSELTVGPSICPGVPLLQAPKDDRLLVALKSGNFGNQDFFLSALNLIRSHVVS